MLASMGLSLSNAFRMLLKRVAAEKALPFEPLEPNAETVQALKAARCDDIRSPRIAKFSLTKPLLYVLVSFMSGVAQLPASTTDPVPPGAAAAMPPALNRVLSLVRKLIDYGKQLAAMVQQRTTTPDFPLFAKPFGTADLAAILARITAGLRRAAALEAALCRRGTRGRDLTPTPIRTPAAPHPCPARQSAPPDTQPDPQPSHHPEDSRLARLPTEAEIAAEVRRRPVGAVIVDICCDLGIAPGHLDRTFWDEISHAIIAYGGSLAGFLGNLHTRLIAFGFADHADWADPIWPAPPPRLPALATGPP